jgi:hypothetical protein
MEFLRREYYGLKAVCEMERKKSNKKSKIKIDEDRRHIIIES